MRRELILFIFGVVSCISYLLPNFVKIYINPKLKCENIEFKVSYRDKWIRMHSESPVFVYSAYNISSAVYLIALKRHGVRLDARCLFLYTDDNGCIQYVFSAIEEQEMPEHKNKKYNGVTIVCKETPKRAIYVSIVTKNMPTYVNVVSIKKTAKMEKNFTLCVRPFINRFSKSNDVIEWMEFNKIMGAERVYFYNYSIHSNTSKVIQHYVKQGSAVVLDWNLPVTDIWQAGQVISIFECMYRNFHTTKYMIHLDIDEFIVPQIHDNWTQMIRSMSNSSSTNFVITNSFFSPNLKEKISNFTNKDNIKIDQFNMKSLRHFSHGRYFYPRKAHAKSIINPRSTKIPGIHFVWKYNKGSSEVIVPKTTAVLQHYRNTTIQEPHLNNKRMLFFKDNLIRNIEITHANI